MMPLSTINFDNIAEADLTEQIATGVPEGIFVDYKKDMYGRSDADVKEFLKDASSFANTAGGHLIVGIDEAGGIPTGINPLNGDADQDLQRMESLLRDGGKYPPAKPGALGFGPLKAALGTLTRPRFLSRLKAALAPQVHLI